MCTTVSIANCEFRVSYKLNGTHEYEYDYFTEEAQAISRYKKLLQQGYICHLEHMDTVLGSPEYLMDDMIN